MQALPTPIDTTALTEPLRRREVRRLWRELLAVHPEASDVGNAVRRFILAVPTFGLPLGILGFASAILAELSEGGSDVLMNVLVISVLGGLTLGCGFLCAWVWFRLRRRRPRKRVLVRLMRFAAANGMEFRPGPSGAHRRLPLRRRGSLNVHRVLRTPGDRGVEFANYEIMNKRSSVTTPQFGGYCALRLPTALPNILLRSEDGPTRPLTLSGVPRDSQRLSLEGDFDRYFELYCPEGYERDALYLFTPDVMARLVDTVRGLDVEIVDDWMLLLSARDLVTDRADRWLALAAAVDALDDRIERWGRWRDERLARGEVVPTPGDDAAREDASVAKPGRRLRVNWGIGTILVVAAMIAGAVVLGIAISMR
ncbi:hypothetical protein NY547_12105 [Cnuibacter physcomitrellae]|uniref:hypothetical protein n=1 Tax=Cnuibacter physcomitrellae TaxID=1619308 RepID=UPI002175C200|nr:hypothetical protein [Cnuibacter physcomitrellae]MCS5497983.1 hypothetical protein [Cnuibacter physcomitrellae]